MIPPPVKCRTVAETVRNGDSGGRGDSFAVPNPGQGMRIEPLWVEQHADDIGSSIVTRSSMMLAHWDRACHETVPKPYPLVPARDLFRAKAGHPELLKTLGKRPNAKEARESGRIRPRQVRYQAALSPRSAPNRHLPGLPTTGLPRGGSSSGELALRCNEPRDAS